MFENNCELSPPRIFFSARTPDSRHKNQCLQFLQICLSLYREKILLIPSNDNDELKIYKKSFRQEVKPFSFQTIQKYELTSTNSVYVNMVLKRILRSTRNCRLKNYSFYNREYFCKNNFDFNTKLQIEINFQGLLNFHSNLTWNWIFILKECHRIKRTQISESFWTNNSSTSK